MQVRSNDLLSSSLSFFRHPDQDKCIGKPPGVSKCENVLEQLSFLRICSTFEQVLFPLEVETIALLFMQQSLDQIRIHSRPSWVRVSAEMRAESFFSSTVDSFIDLDSILFPRRTGWVMEVATLSQSVFLFWADLHPHWIYAG